MFNNILFYLVIGLSASTMGFGYLSLSLHDDKVVAVEALRVSKESVSTLENSLNLKGLSCDIDGASTVELESDKTILKDKTEVISQEISKLPSGIKKLPTINNIITEAPKNAEESNVLTGGELLSDDLRKLLLRSYCNVEPNDQQCLPTR